MRVLQDANIYPGSHQKSALNSVFKKYIYISAHKSLPPFSPLTSFHDSGLLLEKGGLTAK